MPVVTKIDKRKRGRPPGSKNKPKVDTAIGQFMWKCKAGVCPNQSAIIKEVEFDCPHGMKRV